jgi:DNA-directed RNA polymerase specialized sigma24 family protein
MEFEEKMAAEFEKLADINDTLDRLQDPKQREVLVKHYLGGKPWHQIADETFYSERTIRYVHTAALAEVEKLIEILPCFAENCRP